MNRPLPLLFGLSVLATGLPGWLPAGQPTVTIVHDDGQESRVLLSELDRAHVFWRCRRGAIDCNIDLRFVHAREFDRWPDTLPLALLPGGYVEPFDCRWTVSGSAIQRLEEIALWQMDFRDERRRVLRSPDTRGWRWHNGINPPPEAWP